MTSASSTCSRPPVADLRELTPAEARRIAVRAQLLDGTARDVLGTVERLGFLQLDPISAVAPPQHLVLFSRLGPAYDRAELDRLLWKERKLFEWNAFIWPMKDLPLVRARMRRWGTGERKWERWAREFLREHAGYRRYILRELERRGPLLSRELEDPRKGRGERQVWWGTRPRVTWMLELLHNRGAIAVVGRRAGQRLWDVAERWYPETETVPLSDANRILAEEQFRALGVRVRRKGGFEAHPDVTDGAVPKRVTVLSPFDRLIHDRDRAEALWGFRYRIEIYVPKEKREYGYYVLPILYGERLIGRGDLLFDRKAGVLRIHSLHAEPGAPSEAGEHVARAIRDLAVWLGADRTAYSRRVARIWRSAVA